MIARLVKCMATGAVVAAAMAVNVLTAGHRALTAQAAAQAQREVVTGGIVLALVLGAAFFAVASAASWSWARWGHRAAARIRAAQGRDGEL